jgi:hypothetical protein
MVDEDKTSISELYYQLPRDNDHDGSPYHSNVEAHKVDYTFR